MEARVLERYRTEVRPKLSEEFGYKNFHQVPTLTKIVVNIGLGEAAHRIPSCWRRPRRSSPA